MKKIYSICLSALLSGCLWVKSEPVEVEPIHVTVDVNVRVRAQKELDDFFGEIDAADPTIEKHNNSTSKE